MYRNDYKIQGLRSGPIEKNNLKKFSFCIYLKVEVVTFFIFIGMDNSVSPPQNIFSEFSLEGHFSEMPSWFTAAKTTRTFAVIISAVYKLQF